MTLNGPASPTNTTGYVYAGFWQRVPAMMLDLAVLLAVTMAADRMHLSTADISSQTVFEIGFNDGKVAFHYSPTAFG